jgi:hypothetical protein
MKMCILFFKYWPLATNYIYDVQNTTMQMEHFLKNGLLLYVLNSRSDWWIIIKKNSK